MVMCFTHIRFYDLYIALIWLTCLDICFCISNTGRVWLNKVGQDREIEEEHDKYSWIGVSGNCLGRWYLGLAHVMLEYNYIQFFSIITGKTLNALRASLLLSSSNGVFADTVDISI